MTNPCRKTLHLLRIDQRRLYVEDINIIDQTPLFDIKPFVPEFDLREAESIGWLENKSGKAEILKDDGRFTE